MSMLATALASLTCGYAAYYLTRVIHRPTILASSTSFIHALRCKMPILGQLYWPTFWSFHKHPMIILTTLLRKMAPAPNYRREVCSTSTP